MFVDVMKVAIDEGIVELILQPSHALLQEQARVAAAVDGQLPFKPLHVTLCKLDVTPPDVPLPPPPAQVELIEQSSKVSWNDKSSVFLCVTSQTRRALVKYIQDLEATWNIVGLREKKRMFHVSLTNREGEPQGSLPMVAGLTRTYV